MKELYADIVTPIAQPPFTYRVADELCGEIELGDCVVVQLGRNSSKHYVGIVWRIHSERPDYKHIKRINRRVERSPRLSHTQMKLWEWISSYYMCTLGEVMRAALPSSLKPEGFSQNGLLEDSYTPPTTTILNTHPRIDNINTLNEALDSQKRAPRRYAALLELTEQAVVEANEHSLESLGVSRSKINAPLNILKALADKEIITIHEQVIEIDHLPDPPSQEQLPKLTNIQESALHQIIKGKDVTLLHGITGSGKTEIYIHLIAKHISEGGDVLYLLPEIALTSQLIERIKHYFGDRVVTYHSRHPEARRVRDYMRIAKHRGGEIIIGVRSALFLPIGNLSLVIVDEEHETSYKQMDPAPRYNARDCAILYASICGAKTLLGSATPSIESYTNGCEGKYTLVEINERYGGAKLPSITVSDTIRASKRGERKSHFNKLLIDKIKETLQQGNQVILFQNRRGYSPYVECPECGWSARCPHCNVSLTLHKSDQSLKCHYCGYTQTAPTICPSCNVGRPAPMGFGTEKIEFELQEILPDTRIARLDRDTTRTERQYNQIINSFSRRETDILIGTMMITKGFDFSGVSLVGILNADNMLNYPDFRAGERAFQLMTQVAGRAGRRKDDSGEVIIQSSQPNDPIIEQVKRGDFKGMVTSQLIERNQFNYPPYCRLISITLRHQDKILLHNAAAIFGAECRKIFGSRLLGPEAPPVDKIRDEYLLSFLLKIERTASSSKAKELLLKLITTMHSDPKYRYINVLCNVDPQ